MKVIVLCCESDESFITRLLTSTSSSSISSSPSSPDIVLLDAASDPCGWFPHRGRVPLNHSKVVRHVVSNAVLEDLNQLLALLVHVAADTRCAVLFDSLSPLLFRHSAVKVAAFLRQLKRCAATSSSSPSSLLSSSSSLPERADSENVTVVSPPPVLPLFSPLFAVVHVDALSVAGPEVTNVSPSSMSSSSASSLLLSHIPVAPSIASTLSILEGTASSVLYAAPPQTVPASAFAPQMLGTTGYTQVPYVGCHIMHKRNSAGKVVRGFEECVVNPRTGLMKGVARKSGKKAPDGEVEGSKGGKDKPKISNPEDLTDELTFNLRLTTKQKAERALVDLPYVHQGGGTAEDREDAEADVFAVRDRDVGIGRGGGKGHYDDDDVDAFNDDDDFDPEEEFESDDL